MTAPSDPAVTSVQVLAARVRLKADKRLGRATPEKIKSIAAGEIPRPSTTSA